MAVFEHSLVASNLEKGKSCGDKKCVSLTCTHKRSSKGHCSVFDVTLFGFFHILNNSVCGCVFDYVVCCFNHC